MSDHDKRNEATAPGATDVVTEALSSGLLVLRLVFAALLAGYLLSGLYVVPQQKRACVLLFGKVQGQGEGRIKGPGLHWTLPRPLAEIRWIETGRVRTVEVDPLPLSGDPQSPIFKAEENPRHLLTGDASLLRMHWALRYTVEDPEAWLFRLADPDAALQAALRASTIAVLSGKPVDQAHRTDVEATRAAVEDELRRRVADLGAGVRVERVEIAGLRPPEPVAQAFEEVTRAEQESSAKILESRQYASQQLFESRGQAAKTVAEAESRQKRFVEKAAADASYFLKILPGYRENPDIVRETLRQDAVRRALASAKDKYFLYRGPDGRRELRLWLGPEKNRPGETKKDGEKKP